MRKWNLKLQTLHTAIKNALNKHLYLILYKWYFIWLADLCIIYKRVTSYTWSRTTLQHTLEAERLLSYYYGYITIIYPDMVKDSCNKCGQRSTAQQVSKFSIFRQQLTSNVVRVRIITSLNNSTAVCPETIKKSDINKYSCEEWSTKANCKLRNSDSNWNCNMDINYTQRHIPPENTTSASWVSTFSRSMLHGLRKWWDSRSHSLSC